jgi:hypothetical protein
MTSMPQSKFSPPVRTILNGTHADILGTERKILSLKTDAVINHDVKSVIK